MRILTDHQTNPANEALTITVTDEPGAGGACHRYVIEGFEMMDSNKSAVLGDPNHKLAIVFQNGPIKENGVNGITQEALLAILIDRLKGFQFGAFTTKANAVALTHLETALLWLGKRTRDRQDRRVEGTMEK